MPAPSGFRPCLRAWAMDYLPPAQPFSPQLESVPFSGVAAFGAPLQEPSPHEASPPFWVAVPLQEPSPHEASPPFWGASPPFWVALPLQEPSPHEASPPPTLEVPWALFSSPACAGC